MAVGGGTFVVQDKVLPGTYVNFVSKTKAMGELGKRGAVAFAFYHTWGDYGAIIELTAENFESECFKYFCCSSDDYRVRSIRELLRGANKVYVYIMQDGNMASYSDDDIEITALRPGMLGNTLVVKIVEDIDNEGYFWINTYAGERQELADKKYVKNGEDIYENYFVEFNVLGELVPGTYKLSGGTSELMNNTEFIRFYKDVERYPVDVIILDNIYRSAFQDITINFVKRMREEVGQKLQYVTTGENKYDYEGVVCLDKYSSIFEFWVAGQLAGANINESLTNKKYDGEMYQSNMYSRTEMEADINAGLFVMYKDGDDVRVLKDINCYISFTVAKNKDFANNQVIRVLDRVAVDIADIFNKYYLGKVQNNSIGRDLFKAELVNYHNKLQGIQAIENFESDDIAISIGDDKTSVAVEEYIQPVAAMDKLYISCVLI